MKISILIPAFVLAAVILSSCKSTPDRDLLYFKLADQNINTAGQCEDPKDAEKYYTISK